MKFDVDNKHHSIVLTFTLNEQAEFMTKRFCDSWDYEREGEQFRLDLLTVFQCHNMFCVHVDPWIDCDEIDGFEQFKQYITEMSEGIDG